MGWSATTASIKVMDKVMSDFSARGNCWQSDGKEYFWERGREQRDGAFVGSVHLCLPGNMARKAGSFRIEPDGMITRFAGIPVEYRAAHNKAIRNRNECWRAIQSGRTVSFVVS